MQGVLFMSLKIDFTKVIQDLPFEELERVMGEGVSSYQAGEEKVEFLVPFFEAGEKRLDGLMPELWENAECMRRAFFLLQTIHAAQRQILSSQHTEQLALLKGELERSSLEGRCCHAEKEDVQYFKVWTTNLLIHVIATMLMTRGGQYQREEIRESIAKAYIHEEIWARYGMDFDTIYDQSCKAKESAMTWTRAELEKKSKGLFSWLFFWWR